MHSGKIPAELIGTIVKKHDIVEVMGRHGVQLTRQGHVWKALCPFHSEKTPSFSVDPEKQLYYCFGCHAGGDVIRFVMDYEGIPFPEALAMLATEAGVELGTNGTFAVERQDPEREQLLNAYELATKLYHYILLETENGREALQVLRSRGMTDELIETFRIGYAPQQWDTLTRLLEKRAFDLPLMEAGGLISTRSSGDGYFDKFRDRLMIPIHNQKGEIIAFGGRAMGEATPKYLNSPESKLFIKGKSLFNLHRIKQTARKNNQVLLLEGYFDVIQAWHAGLHTGVASMGTALTPEQATLIRRMSEKVTIVYDGDRAGQQAAFKSIDILEKASCQVSVAMLPEGEDPDEFIRSRGADRFVTDVVNTAIPAMDFRLHFARRQFRMDVEHERVNYLEHALGMIAQLNEPLKRQFYVRQLSTEFQVPFEVAWQNLNEIRNRYVRKERNTDKNEEWWNNEGNYSDGRQVAPLLPAYHQAERQLLALMLANRELCDYVQVQLGDAFNVELHAALAAHLYAWYGEGNEPDVGLFVAFLQDEELERQATSIALAVNSDSTNARAIDDYIREIRKVPQLQQIQELKDQQLQAQQAGNWEAAARLGMDIIVLERQLKSS